jgi:hypothetical protein
MYIKEGPLLGEQLLGHSQQVAHQKHDLIIMCSVCVLRRPLFHTMGDFKVGVSVGVYCTKCTLNTGVNTNFEITQCMSG